MSNWGKKRWFFSRMNVKFDEWPWTRQILIDETGLVILLKLDLIVDFSACVTWNLMDDLEKIIGHLFCTTFFVLSDLEIWRMNLTNKRAPPLCCSKLCASFHSHQWIQTKVTVRKHSIRVKIGDFLSCVTLKFDRWPWKTKTIGHLFYVAPSFVHYFIAISEFKLKLQSGNAQFGSKSAILCPMWPWNLIDDLEKQ